MSQNHPEMPAAIIGNSKMLLSARENGELFKLFWPQIDYGQHLGHLWPGIKLAVAEGQSFTKWFHLSQVWQSTQRYLPNTNILETELHSQTHRLQVTQRDFVLPAQDVLVRYYTLTNHSDKNENIFFLVYGAFELEESTYYDGAYFDSQHQALVFHRRNVYFALSGGRDYNLSGYQCGRRGTHSDPFQNASRGILEGGGDNIRQSSGSLAWNLGELPTGATKDFILYLVAGVNREEMQAALTELNNQTGPQLLEKTKRYWHTWLEEGGEKTAAYTRSLLAMKLMTNKETGASIAAPEFDPGYTACGGYGYCWPRDSVFIATAFDEAGYHALAAQFYQFMRTVQTKEGDWEQRYFTDGSVAPCWGKQIDQTGAVLWGYRHHYNLTGDDRFLTAIWPSMRIGAEYLAHNLADNGLPRPSFDPWEDEYSQGTYSAAAVYGGLTAASTTALQLGVPEAARQWQAAAATIKEAILKQLWSDGRQSFTRGTNRRTYKDMHDHAAGQGKGHFDTTDPTGIYQTYWVEEDLRLDTALLGLAFPFAVFEAGEEKMRATAQAIEKQLWNHNSGGLYRYEGDNYRGGNPWLITTLWLAIYYCLLGERQKAEQLYNWCLAQGNSHQLLPEQAEKNHGGPIWVLPLNWSHAMHILTQLALDSKLSLKKG